MRPLKLTMTAFGPYKEQETIDFTRLEQHRLFVISGNTGAGKTTIFDAISYALYDTASGEDRYESRMLRSHFADDQTPTTVEFDFSTGRRAYRVVRQLAYKKAGNKSETPPRAELYELTSGKPEPCVDRFTISDVNQKLQSIIGLTKEQFSQIVMLPQGEFRKLLTSDTENKEEILRRIFRTELFQKLEERFKSIGRTRKEQVDQARTELDFTVRRVSSALPRREGSELASVMAQEHRNVPQLLAALEGELAHYGELQREAAGRKERQEAELARHTERYHKAQALAERFAELARKQAELRRLDEQAGAMLAGERRLTLAEQAQRVEPYEQQRARVRAQLEQLQAKLQLKRREAAQAEQSLQAAEERFREEEAREPERREAEAALRRLQEMQPIVKSLHERRQQLERLLQEERQAGSRLEQADARLLKLQADKSEAGAAIKELERRTADFPAKTELLSELRVRASIMQDVLKLEDQLAVHGQQLQAEQGKLVSLQELHRELETAWIEGQAGLLASHLHDGQPCPVCGSAEHPAKAELAERVPTREQLAEAKEQLRIAQDELSRAEAMAAAASDGMGSKRELLRESGFVPEDVRRQYAELVAEGKRLKAELDALAKDAEQLKRHRETMERLEAELEQQAAAKQQLTETLGKLALDRTAKQTELQSDYSRVPEQLRDFPALERRLKEQNALAESLLATWKMAQERSGAARIALAQEQATVRQMAEQAEEAALAQTEANQRFEHALAECGLLDETVYLSSRMDKQEMAGLKAELERYKTEKTTVQTQMEELSRELAGKQPENLEEISELLTKLKAESDALSQQLLEMKAFLQQAQLLIEALADTDAKLKKLEDEYGQLMDVYNVLKGDNALRMSFERYILIEYLEQILQAANSRLRRLSNGQYVLHRSERIEKHNRPSGLGLDVYDAYTGQYRDVKTLSGGEKFNASLCLALGMTDVIQASQGSVSIEMMFIDEGFGTLDEESLGKAIETLIDLQRSGRLIGVISHVPEIKAAFPAVLEVRKSREGFSRTELVLK
jgi:exonuclease SbcC